ncbi:MAG: pyridoxamine 5'-phosphate oxidase family protein [Rhodoferax sp.]|uniref:pyridoxamine 5'-phosphate oxidase family protein n=1 Tax=Rhodoferax sp. TaxID=50421 RepID=UPI002ACF0683|nr:pyridoxamine 5'-phosphate oxidase family protein [Rhodoferax sp.]MDZ7890975.1 pyridoxamine 5'-phosphate oxidase family protein [Rhodoferax sp.]
MDTHLLSKSDIRHRIWQELQRAVVDRHHEWRTPVLATLGVDGAPQARTVVLRHADSGRAVLHIYTDSRSPKVAELEAAPQVSLVFWSKRLSWQLRMRAQATVQRSGPEVDAVWARISTSAAAGDYLSAQAPGAVLDTAAEGHSKGVSGPHHLALIKLQVLEIDWLELARSGHRRASLTQTGWTWRVP